jgi:hypothetical protein
MGRYLSVLLAKDGADVVACDVNQETLNETVEMLRKFNVSVSSHVLDVADKEAIEALPQKVIDQHGKVDFVLNHVYGNLLTSDNACNDGQICVSYLNPGGFNGGACYSLSILGCTDQNALNYDLDVTEDDGSCIISGCLNIEACNYNLFANIDNDSCVFNYGCRDSNTLNFDPNACFDDGSCIAINLGCTDNYAINYNELANTDDGSCLIWNYPLITSCDMTIGITTESFISLDDEDLELGDWIGAFYLDENGNEVCGGAFEWLGENSVISLLS